MKTHNLQLERPLCSIDLETTGVSITEDRIVQISIIKMFVDGTLEYKTRLINPNILISKEAKKVHGISNSDVDNEPTFSKLAKGFRDYIKDCDIMGYNSNRFDVPLMQMEFERCGINNAFTGVKFIDAFKIFCHLHPRTLGAAFKMYTGLEIPDAHDAEADNIATVTLLEKMVDKHDFDPKVKELSEIGNADKWCDIFGKIRLNEDGVKVWGFGKNFGKPILDDKAYITWVLTNDFPENTKDVLRLIQKIGR